MGEVVFIFGAGASRDSGAPLMHDFWSVMEDLHDRRRLNADNDFLLVQRARAALLRTQAKSAIDIDNLESLFATFEMAHMLRKMPGMQPAETQYLSAAFRRLIAHTLEQAVTFTIQNGTLLPTEPYGGLCVLAKQLQRDGRRVSFITFNYDLAIDYTMTVLQMNPDYGLSREPLQGTPLLKLHGSINWKRCQGNSKIVDLSLSEYLGYRLPFLQTTAPNGPFQIEMSRESFSPRDGRVLALEDVPAIVPPTWNKMEHYQRMQNVWRHAAVALGSAEHLFIIGYSLPASDSFFEQLFALGTEGTLPLKSFHVFNPNGDLKLRFERLCGPNARNRFKYEPVGFSEALEHLCHTFHQPYPPEYGKLAGVG